MNPQLAIVPRCDRRYKLLLGAASRSIRCAERRFPAGKPLGALKVAHRVPLNTRSCATEMELLSVPTPRNQTVCNCGDNEFALDHRQQLSIARGSFPNSYEGCDVRLVARLSR